MHSGLNKPPASTSTLSCWASCVARLITCVASPFGSTYVTSSGWPLMPPLALVRCTTRSVLTRISAPSMAPTPVTSSITPTLIGAPPGLAAAAAVVGAAAAGAVVGAAAAGAVVAAGAAAAVVGLAAAGAVVGAAAGGVVGAGGVAAGVEHAAKTQASDPKSKAC